MTKKKRIVVTGMSVVSCFGTDVDTFYDSLLKGKSGVRPIDAFPCEDFPTRFAAAVQNFEVGDYLDRKQARRVDPFIRYSVVGGKKALEDAGLKGDAFDKLDKARCGILIGSGMGGMSVFQNGTNTLREKGFSKISPFFVPYIITNMGGALLAIDLGFTGPNYSISTACATSNYCIVNAANHIRNGEADLIVCGGAEAPINPIGVAGFVACKALSERNEDPTTACRPWDKTRDGFVIGEGAGVLVLESLEHAEKRGATILAEYVGGGLSCDAYHMTSPKEDGSGIVECMTAAFDDAMIEKEQINYINAHATSTPAGDLCELRGIKSIFKDHAKNISINATKSMTGHCLGAAAGIEAVATIKAIQTDLIHPTINCKDREEESQDMDLVLDKVKEKKITGAISTSFGFGGHNSAVIFAPFVK